MSWRPRLPDGFQFCLCCQSPHYKHHRHQPGVVAVAREGGDGLILLVNNRVLLHTE